MNLILWILTALCFSFLLIIYNFWKKNKKLKRNLDSLADISFELTGSAEQVGTVSRDVQDASIEQLETLGATMSTSHEINAMMNRTSDNTNSLNTEAFQLKEFTLKGSDIIEEMVQISLDMKKGSD